jgi:integrase
MEDLKHLWITGGDHGMIFFKLNIPKDLRHHFRTKDGKTKDRIVESTGTDSRTQARVFRDKRLGYWRAKFEHLRKGGQLSDMLPNEIAAEVQDAYADQRAILQAEGREVLATLDRTWLEQPDKLGEVGRLVVRAMLAAEHGLPVPEVPGATAPTPAPTAPTTAPTGGGETFSQALAAYLAWLKDERQSREATVKDFRTRGQKFINHAGDLPLAAITYDVAKDFADHVAKDNGNGNAANKARSLCYSVIEHARERRRFDFTAQNPFKFRGRKHVVHPHDKFTADDLRAFFRSPMFTKREIKPKKYNVRSALPWVAAIGLYTGARAEEIVQLRRGDLRQENGIWLFDITPVANAAGKLKNENSKRKVPVHDALIKLGLLDYHKALPNDAERLFPNLPVSKKDGKFWPTVGKAFARWRKAVGVDRPPEKLDFHSFRHTYTKALEDADVAKHDADRLTGHEVEGITYGLHSAPELKRLVNVIKRVRFEL